MIGAIIGDIVGSRFEFKNHLSTDFEMFTKECTYTDDTVMTCAVADLLLHSKRFNQTAARVYLQKYGRAYPKAGYGNKFSEWIYSEFPQPYNSCGNGAAMRISPVAWAAESEYEVQDMSYKVTAVTHNHPEGIAGAKVVAMCIYMAREGINKWEILEYARKEYGMDKKFFYTCEEWREENDGKHGMEICQVSVPQALACFREGKNFEEVIRNSIAIGGDSDTVATIAGSIAEAYYGVPEWMEKEAYKYLPEELKQLVCKFENKYY